MADKVVTLTNKDGTDKIYPVAGAMMADSINTNMLKDQAVTSDKIDWTTMKMAAFYTLTSKTTTTYDCSMIPDGSDFLIIASGYGKPGGGSGLGQRFTYNGVNSTSIWADNPASSAKAISITSMGKFTKVAGVDTFTFNPNLNATAVSEFAENIAVFRV